MKITWLGHSCFKLESQGYTIILDPYEDGYVPGLAPVRETADAVFCSHEHNDHNARTVVTLKNSDVPSPFAITEIHTWHDEVQGAKRGANGIRIFDDGTYRVAHLGDLGCELEPEQLEQLKNLDAVMIPVGGFFTIDAAQAKKLVDQIQPRVTIPMHYRSENFGYDVLGTLEDFTALCDCVVEYPGNSIELNEEMLQQTAVLKIR
ncbi:MBL fold metallo-hydrolase [Clostridium sp. AF32-12BH]|uniref:MBL fold metallo-hydrolase n=1 Tax=Clostridium sp. AF32-12BH TaxID=2292006 RepID=UPI000E508674|nr:MBL fold metallo-hydrolase [Clostridium sp. AF32-12BH]RHP48078.1 Zn-dependent hydrolase [Clostridium sp. AF32-12BH]